MNTLEFYYAYKKAGLDVIPVHPKHKYSYGVDDHRNHVFTDQEVKRYLAKGWGLAIRYVAALDFDNKVDNLAEIFDQWKALVNQRQAGLVDRLLIEKSQNNGFHVAWKCEVTESKKDVANRKATPAELAQKPNEKTRAFVELFGLKSHLVCYPTPGYELLQGSWTTLPEITPAEREILISSAKAFDKLPKYHQNGGEPWERYDQHCQDEAYELLLQHGWKVARKLDGGVTYLTRPGKDQGVSATFGHIDSGGLFNFSSNASPFEVDKAYSPSAIYALLEHGGNFSQSAKALAKRFSGNGSTQNGNGTEPGNEAKPRQLLSFADIIESLADIGWEWEPWLPRGVITLLASESGTGKSSMALRIAACYLRGDPWPNGERFAGKTGKVLWCEAEAAQALNGKRMVKWGLPPEKIVIPLTHFDDIMLDNPDHRAEIAYAASDPEVRLVIIDSLSASTQRDSKSSTEMLHTMRFLAQLARDHGKPLLVTHHLRKKNQFDGTVITLDRIRDSSAIVQLARVVWALDNPNFDDVEHKRLSVIKNNLARFPDPIGLRIQDNGLEFGNAPQEPKIETAFDLVCDLLLDLLKPGPMPANEIFSEVQNAGLSVATARRAKKHLGIVAVKPGGVWQWSLSQNEPEFEF